MAELVAAAAASGDRLRTLRAMRDVLAQAMDEAPAAVVAQVAARLQSVVAEIEAVERQQPQRSVVDELRRRRAEREGAAGAVVPAKKPSRKRAPG